MTKKRKCKLFVKLLYKNQQQTTSRLEICTQIYILYIFLHDIFQILFEKYGGVI